MNRQSKLEMISLMAPPAPALEWSTLPAMRDVARRQAGRALPRLASIIEQSDAILLTVLFQKSFMIWRATLFLWEIVDGGLKPVPLDRVSNDREAFQRGKIAGQGLSRLLADLVRRWPANMVPEQIGLVTDGTGLAFHPSHPCGASQDWIGGLFVGPERPIELLPFSADGYLNSIRRGERITRH